MWFQMLWSAGGSDGSSVARPSRLRPRQATDELFLLSVELLLSRLCVSRVADRVVQGSRFAREVAGLRGGHAGATSGSSIVELFLLFQKS